jgi:5'-nucleotidase (lipoprotein e(P4) family)
MRAVRAATIALLLGGAPMLTGCIAAVAAIPLAAAGAIGRKAMTRGADERKAEMGNRAPAPIAAPTPSPTGNAALIVPSAPAPTPAPPPKPVAPPAGMQYLYGSGEAAALSIQAYQALWNYLQARVAEKAAGGTVRGVVLAKDGTLEAPKFVTCGKKQSLAVVLDVDETALLNLGYEDDSARRNTDYDDARWKRWEATGADKVAAVPGAVETLDAARRAGIVVVFNSNRSQANAGGTIAALAIAGLGSAELGKTLWLRADGPGTSGKDSRRAEIADKYCVVALVGDQLGDFSDLFNPGGVPVPVRRNMTTETLISGMWGSGWFMLPNPVYGTGLHGGFDDLFPENKRWRDPADGPAPFETPAPAPAPTPTPAVGVAPVTETTKPQ